MVRIPGKRLTVYVVTILGLLALWTSTLPDILSSSARNLSGIFRPPRDSGDIEFLAVPDSGAATPTLAAQRDPFADELRALSSDESDDAPAEKQEAATPTPTFTPSDNQGSDDEDESLSGGDDVRTIFNELEPKEGNKVSDPLGGVVVRGAPPAVQTPVATPTDQRLWASGQARGYTMLYAMQPEARAVVESQIQTLLSSRIRELYIGVLIDGTFSRDFTYLKDIIARLSSDDQSLTVALYLSNGPTMRKARQTPIDALFSRIEPDLFRQRIRREQQLRAQYLAVALQAKDVFEFNRSLSPKNSNVAFVMLEDNLDVFAYRSMREIAAEQVESVATMMRNPCLGCYQGNDDDTSGDAREEHSIERFSILKRGDAYSFDGEGFRYPGGEGDGVGPDKVAEIMRTSFERGLRYVGLWRHDWQGVKEGVPNKLPSERVYIPSTPDQQEFELLMLRTGLVVEERSDNEG
jgi:hypothetical protein